jgi:hypothetical protein
VTWLSRPPTKIVAFSRDWSDMFFNADVVVSSVGGCKKWNLDLISRAMSLQTSQPSVPLVL